MLRFGPSLAILLALPLLAAPSPNEKQIAQLYDRALGGDAAAVNECIARLEQVLALRPNDELARVYLGSASTLRSRDLGFGLEKISALHRGEALMDEAAAAAPDDTRVQLVRAVTYEAFPAVLARGKIARQALDDLVARVEKNPNKLEPRDRQLLYLNAGRAAEKAGDKNRATELRRRGIALGADEKLTRELEAVVARP
jgi:tetratricopeptide (TPR) repeat protein